MKTMTYLGFLSVPLCFCQHLQAQNNSRQTNPPNIIVILADDMGYGDVSAFNEHSGITTRNLDEMADNGVSFTDAPVSYTHLDVYKSPSSYLPPALSGEYMKAIQKPAVHV